MRCCSSLLLFLLLFPPTSSDQRLCLVTEDGHFPVTLELALPRDALKLCVRPRQGHEAGCLCDFK